MNGLTRTQAASLDHYLTTPPDEREPESAVDLASDRLTPICHCSAYRFPHRPGGGSCYSCPDCHRDTDFCRC